MPTLRLPIDAAHILELQGVDSAIQCTMAERVQLNLLASLLLELQHTNDLLRKQAERSRAAGPSYPTMAGAVSPASAGYPGPA